MAIYKISISTEKYIPYSTGKRNEGFNEMNKFMEKLNGWQTEEIEIDHVRWRILYFFFYKTYFSVPGWLTWFHDRRNFIEYTTDNGTFYRASLYQEADGEAEAGEYIKQLIGEGKIRLPFSISLTDERFKDCYMLIETLEE